jgi:NAD(P)-dependent dehydrogenase (short-subunit alcohol dehydrogenase family)
MRISDAARMTRIAISERLAIRIERMGLRPGAGVAPFQRPDGAGRGLLVMLSAKVGSIGDNRLGGWYSYRASKAALNMLVRTAAIELARTRPELVVVAQHPGTVQSALSRPFGGAQAGRPPAQAAGEMLAVLDRLSPADSGQFLSWNGERLPW